jgi:hypothetical protein
MAKPAAWFLAKFAAAAAVLFWLWSQAGWGDAYGRIVLAAVAALSPWTTGYSVDLSGPVPTFVGGEAPLKLPLNLREICASLVPYASLLIASGGRPIASRLKIAGLGLLLLFPVQVGVVTLAPLMMTPHSEWVSNLLDVVYVFAALGGLAALPLFLWWIWWRYTEPEVT